MEAPEQASPYWARIVGEHWPAISPETWQELATTARTGVEALNVRDTVQALSGFNDTIPYSARIELAKDSMADLQEWPQTFATALDKASETLLAMADIVRRCRNNILDTVATANDDITAIPSDAKNRRARINSIVNTANSVVADIASTALREVHPQTLPLSEIAELLNADDSPWAGRAGRGGDNHEAGMPVSKREGGLTNPYPDDRWGQWPWNGQGPTNAGVTPRGDDDSSWRPGRDSPTQSTGPTTSNNGRERSPSTPPATSPQELTPAGHTAPRMTQPAASQALDSTTAPVTAGPPAQLESEFPLPRVSAQPDPPQPMMVDAQPPPTDHREAAAPAVDLTHATEHANVETPSLRSEPAATPPGLPPQSPPVAVGPQSLTSVTPTASTPHMPAAIGPVAGISPAAPVARATPPTVVMPPTAPPPPPAAVAAARAVVSAPSDGPAPALPSTTPVIAPTQVPALVTDLDDDLSVARALLGSIVATTTDVPRLGWAVSVMRGPGRIGVFVTSNEGRGWMPTGLYLPRDVSVPWVWESYGDPARSAGPDPARELIDFGLAWGKDSGAHLCALASSQPIEPGTLDQNPDVPMAGSVGPSPALDLATPRSNLLDRLGVVASPKLLKQLARVPDAKIAERCLTLARDGHARHSHLDPTSHTLPLRQRILLALSDNRAVPDLWWDDLRAADEEAPTPAERRCDELVLLLSGDPTRQRLRDITYAHAHLPLA